MESTRELIYKTEAGLQSENKHNYEWGNVAEKDKSEARDEHTH